MEYVNILEVAFWLCIGIFVTICISFGYEEYLEFKEFEYLNGGGDE